MDAVGAGGGLVPPPWGGGFLPALGALPQPVTMDRVEIVTNQRSRARIIQPTSTNSFLSGLFSPRPQIRTFKSVPAHGAKFESAHLVLRIDHFRLAVASATCAVR